MTAREVMYNLSEQNYLEECMDKYGLMLCIRKIKYEQPEIAVIGDCRFPNVGIIY